MTQEPFIGYRTPTTELQNMELFFFSQTKQKKQKKTNWIKKKFKKSNRKKKPIKPIKILKKPAGSVLVL